MEHITELIAQTELTVRNLSKSYVKAIFQPLYPVVIRLCAPAAEQERIGSLLRAGLHKYWSDLADDVEIIAAENSTDSAEAAALSISTAVRSLLQSKQRFKNLAIILYFDIVQTGQFSSLEEFQAYYQAYRSYQYDENHSVSRMLFLIHDRPVNDPDARRVAGEILRWTEEICAQEQSVVVLSSQLSGGAELASDDDSRYEAAATLIALTDIDTKPNFYAKLFSVEQPRLLTLGRVYHEKPFHLIAVYTVDALIRNIVVRFASADASEVTAEDLRKVFCPQTRFEIADRYYDLAKSVLPDERCMQFLPYQDTKGTRPEQFGAFWQAFFEENFAARIRQKADEQYGQIKTAFLDQLMQHFTHQQLGYLSAHPDVTETFWGSLNTAQMKLTDADYQKACAAVRSIYTDRLVGRLRADMHRILESANSISILLEQLQSRMHDIVFSASANDRMAESVSKYYDAVVVRPYVEQKWTQIRLDFSLVQNQGGEIKPQILALLDKYAKDIIRSDAVYRASFENELQMRMANYGLNDTMVVQNSRAVTTVTDYLMGSGMRQVFLPNMNIEEIMEIYLIPEEAKYLHIVQTRLQETDAIQTIPADQYMERIALMHA